MKLLSFILVLVLAAPMTWAATDDNVVQAVDADESGTSLTTVSVTAPGAITGLVETRPTWTTKSGEFHTENTLALGYEFNPDLAIGYVQYINTNIYDPAADKGVGVIVDDGFARVQLNNLWTNPANGLALSYEPRLYVPTSAASRDAGMVATVRNYIKLKKTFNPTFSITAMELPMFHLYTQAGKVVDGAKSANPVFENRFYVIADWNLGAGIAISVPLLFHQARHADFEAGAANNNTWSFTLYTWPEITYAVTPNVSVGLAYQSGNWVASDLSSFELGKAFDTGMAQFILSASL